MKKVFEQRIGFRDAEYEDSRQAMSIELSKANSDMFVRLHSYNLDKKHCDLEEFVGKKVRVTIETID